MNNPKVSVIIPVYNSEKYLRTCLASIVNQTMKEIEIICVDDGSTDNSLIILKEYEKIDGRITVLTQKNQYAGVARNHGMKIAKGEYFIFWDSDDFFEFDALEQLYLQAKKHKADICVCGADRYDTNEKKHIPTPWWLNAELLDSPSISYKTHSSIIYRFTNIAPWNKLISSDFIANKQLQFQALPRANDVCFVMCALGLASNITYVSKILIHYRIGDETSLQSNNYKTPLIILTALSEVKKRLMLDGIYDILHNSFRNAALSICNYNLLKLQNNENAFRELQSYLVNGKTQEYHINTLRYIDTFNKRDYISFCDLLDNSGKTRDLFDFYLKSNPKVPKVSIIIPIYNCQDYLDECLKSVTKQTYKNIEIICVDDKSEDNSIKIIEKYAYEDSRIHIIAQHKNTRQGGARNVGLDLARGKYVWFIDADDYVDINAVEILVNKMESLEDVDLISFNADSFVIDNEKKKSLKIGNIRREWPKNRKLSVPEDAEIIPACIDGSSVTYFAKRNFIDQFRFRKNTIFEDADFSFALFTSPGGFYEMDYTPYHRRIRSASSTGGGDGINEEGIIGRLLALGEIFKIIKQKQIGADHYGSKWAVKWFRFSQGLYYDHPDYHCDECDQIIVDIEKQIKSLPTGQFYFTKLYKSFPIRRIGNSLISFPNNIVKVMIHVRKSGIAKTAKKIIIRIRLKKL